MKKKYHLILRLTENATTAVLLCHKSAKLISASQNVCSFMDPELGEVYDPLEIAYSVRTVIHQLLKKIKSNDITITDIQIISEPYGVLVWDKSSGMAITQMIKINTKKLTNHGRKKFHLTISKKVSKEIKKKPTVFQSGLHLNWLIESFPDIKKQMQKDKAYCGGVESWIIFNLTGLKSFVTDITHASETF